MEKTLTKELRPGAIEKFLMRALSFFMLRRMPRVADREELSKFIYRQLLELRVDVIGFNHSTVNEHDIILARLKYRTSDHDEYAGVFGEGK